MKGLLLELKDYWAYILILIILFTGTFIYWINSDYYHDTLKMHRAGAIRHFKIAYEYYINGYPSDVISINPSWEEREKYLKKYEIEESILIRSSVDEVSKALLMISENTSYEWAYKNLY